MLIPGNAFPELTISLVSGGLWTLAKSQRELTLIAVSRGFFCKYCHHMLVELDRLANEFYDIGLDIIATSTDDVETATKAGLELGLNQISMGYGLALADIRRLNLFATERAGGVFAEPAILIVRRDGSVYAVFQHSVSCGQIDIQHLLDGMKLLAPAGFPLRGNA